MTIPVAKSEDFRELAEWIASLGDGEGAKDFNPNQLRDEHGRWTDAGLELRLPVGAVQGRGPLGDFHEFVPTPEERRQVVGMSASGETLHIGDHVRMRNGSIGQIYDAYGSDLWVGVPDRDALRFVAASSVERLERKAAQFVEALHPRDAEGRFAEVQGITGILEPPASRLEDFSEPEMETWTLKMAEYGVTVGALRDKIAEVIDQDAIDHARAWYPNAGQVSTDLAAETGISKDRIATALGVCSPQCEWENEKDGEGEKRYVTSMARFVAAGKAKDENGENLDPMDAIMKWKAEYRRTNTNLSLKGEPKGASIINKNGARGLSVMMGVTDPQDELTDNKTVSFFDNIMDPGGTHEVTCDVHMARTLQKVYGVSKADSLAFVAAPGGYAQQGNRVMGVGYVAIAEAVREIASRYDVPPDVAQAAFWEQVQSEPHITWEDGKEWPTGKPKVPKPKPRKSWDLEW